MKRLRYLLMGIIAVAAAMPARAQYYQAVNQATSMLQTALQGGANYRGMVDVSYVNGIGNKQANFLELTTTQGIKYANWFYMGLGAGIDVMFTEVNDNPYRPAQNKGYTQTSAMVPLFTDFRANLGSPTATSFFIDLRVGAGFYINNKYILVGDGYVNTSQSFILRPAIGVRIPVAANDAKHAINISATYQLMTNSYWYSPGGSNSITLNGFGINVGYEW